MIFKEKASMSVLSSEFEVFGTVQGEFWGMWRLVTLTNNEKFFVFFVKIFFRSFLPKGKVLKFIDFLNKVM